VDLRAVEAARVNAELNALAQRVRFEATPLARIDPVRSLVVANIDAETLLALAPQLARHAHRGRALLLTGLLDERAEELSRAYAALGYDEHRRASLEGWALLDLRPRFA
jgi:ribosomal protein L11 methyltransferase